MARRQDPVVDLLSKVDLFSGLTPKEIATIAGAVRPFSFATGATVVTEGEEGARFYLVAEGTADVTIRGHTVATIGPGDYFGEISVIDRGPRAATVVATSPVSTLSLASFTLRPLLRDHPNIMEKLLVRMCARVREQGAGHTC